MPIDCATDSDNNVVKFKQRQILGGAVPFVKKPSLQFLCKEILPGVDHLAAGSKLACHCGLHRLEQRSRTKFMWVNWFTLLIFPQKWSPSTEGVEEAVCELTNSLQCQLCVLERGNQACRIAAGLTELRRRVGQSPFW